MGAGRTPLVTPLVPLAAAVLPAATHPPLRSSLTARSLPQFLALAIVISLSSQIDSLFVFALVASSVGAHTVPLPLPLATAPCHRPLPPPSPASRATPSPRAAPRAREALTHRRYLLLDRLISTRSPATVAGVLLAPRKSMDQLFQPEAD